MKAVYSDLFKDVLTQAREEAVRLGHNYIGTEHLLLGVIRKDGCKAFGVLERLDLDVEGIATVVDDFVWPSRGKAKKSELPLTPRSEKIVNISAVKECTGLGADHVGTSHLLLALVKDRDGVAGQVLAGLDVDYEAVKAAVLN